MDEPAMASRIESNTDLVTFAVVVIAVLLYMIKREITKLITAKEAENHARKAQHLSFDIHTQILANAEVLWMLTQHTMPGITKPPRMTIMLARTEEASSPMYNAEVIFFGARDEDHTHKTSFVTSNMELSAEDAMRSLLDLTAIMVERKMRQAPAWWSRNTEEYPPIGGVIWPPSQNCDCCGKGIET
ncbi:hypothetical protein LTR10_000202 [Elasticomyces elasticus]|nr:hypothetical protein LTR10_000202 [Elasticomyces elasticus]KAK4980539.1 hypothetical protein LTR42_000847 [Elasticomyces elasticus]